MAHPCVGGGAAAFGRIKSSEESAVDISGWSPVSSGGGGGGRGVTADLLAVLCDGG